MQAPSGKGGSNFWNAQAREEGNANLYVEQINRLNNGPNRLEIMGRKEVMAMIIKELEIKNYRGIKTLNIPLNKNGAVFYGINGVGKSTVIKAINVLLSQIIDRVSNGRFKNRISIGEEDVSYGHSITMLTAAFALDQDQYVVSKAYDKKKRASLHVNKTLMELSNFIRTKLLETPSFELPIFVVYGVNRSVVDIPLRIRKTHSFDRIAAYEKSSAGTDFRVFFEWFRNQEDYENQVRANDDNNYQDQQLKTVREAIYRLMPGFSKLMVERKPKLKMVVAKNNTKLSINQLSDGEKCYIAMIGDLARRMAIANPDAKDPLKCSGIVLIDEVELHLHPEWQRKIVPTLRNTFPNIQFIITTHSPQVLGEIKDMDIYKLSKMDGSVIAHRITATFGRDSDFILKQFMDTPEKNTEIINKINNLYNLINLKDYSKAESLLEELSIEIGNDDADVVKGRILVARGRARGEANIKKR